MPWAAGSFSRLNGDTGWVDDASLGIGIEAGEHDLVDTDFKNGINQCLNKDGSNAATGNLNLGGFRPVNVAAGTAAAPAIVAGGDVNTGIFSAAADQIGIATNGAERVRITNNGTILTGVTSARSNLFGSIPSTVQSEFLTGTSQAVLYLYHSNDAASGYHLIGKTRGTSTGSNTAVQNGDQLGALSFVGADGANIIEGVRIQANVDGAPGANDMPTRLAFFTTPDGSGAVTERMRINSAGVVCVGTATSFIGAAGGLCITSGGATGATYSFATQNSASGLSFSIANDGAIRTGALTNSPFNQTTGLGANMYVNSVGDLFRSTSSLKYKTDVTDYDKGLEDVLQLQPKYYKAKNAGAQVLAGLIAEQVHEVGLSEFVQYADDNSPDAISYGHMAALFTKAIQELNAKVEALEARVAELEAA